MAGFSISGSRPFSNRDLDWTIASNAPSAGEVEFRFQTNASPNALTVKDVWLAFNMIFRLYKKQYLGGASLPLPGPSP